MQESGPTPPVDDGWLSRLLALLAATPLTVVFAYKAFCRLLFYLDRPKESHMLVLPAGWPANPEWVVVTSVAINVRVGTLVPNPLARGGSVMVMYLDGSTVQVPVGEVFNVQGTLSLASSTFTVVFGVP